MADEVVGLRIEVDSNVGEAVGSLRSQLKAAQAEVAAMSEKFGVTSKEAAEAAKRAAELKDKIGDAKALTDAFNPDAKFKALSASLSGVAGGFAAVQGAMGLFGTESKDLEKQLLKVQSALALSQGLQSLGEAKDSFIQLGAVIKSQVVSAFSTLRGAIIATGIGALAVGLGLVVANFEAFKKAVYNLLPGLETVVKYIGGLVTKMTDFVGITSEADRQLEKLNKTTDKYGAQLEREIALLKARGDEVGAFNKQREKLEGDLAQARANYGKNNEKEWGKIILDTKNALEILKIEEQKYLAEQKAKRDEAADKRAKELQEQRLKESAHLEEIAAVQVKGNEEINAKLLGLAEKRKVDQINVQEDLNRDSEYLARQNYQTALMFADLLGGLADAAGELAGKNTAEGKALSIATTLISTYLAAQKAYESQFSPVPDASSPIRGAIAAATAVVQGLARLKAIQAVQIPNSKGGGSSPSGGGYSFSSGGTAPISPQTNVVTTQLTNQNLNELKNNTVKAYVVESEMTDAQTRIRRIQQAAEFGG